MQQVWFTADTHFGHANIIRYGGRPFADADAHDAALIDIWNAHVSPRDLVYHVGDFSFRATRTAAEYRRRLHGQIYLIEGNHNAAAKADRGVFLHVAPVAEVKVNGQRIWLSHSAHRVWSRSHHGAWHLYGHSHNSLADDADTLSFDEIAAVMASKRFVPVDHHGRDG